MVSAYARQHVQISCIYIYTYTCISIYYYNTCAYFPALQFIVQSTRGKVNWYIWTWSLIPVRPVLVESILRVPGKLFSKIFHSFWTLFVHFLPTGVPCSSQCKSNCKLIKHQLVTTSSTLVQVYHTRHVCTCTGWLAIWNGDNIR